MLRAKALILLGASILCLIGPQTVHSDDPPEDPVPERIYRRHPRFIGLFAVSARLDSPAGIQPVDEPHRPQLRRPRRQHRGDRAQHAGRDPGAEVYGFVTLDPSKTAWNRSASGFSTTCYRKKSLDGLTHWAHSGNGHKSAQIPLIRRTNGPRTQHQHRSFRRRLPRL